MSILDFPRMNFKGIFKTNPCTANNDDVVPSVVTRDTNSLGPDLAGKDDDGVTEYLGQAVKMYNFSDDPAQGAKKKTFIRAGWNPYGDHVTTFEDTSISSVIYGPPSSPTANPVVDSATSTAADPIVGVSLEIIGTPTPNGSKSSTPMIVDLDPTGLVTTQLFIGGIRFSFKDDAGKQKQVDVLHDTRGYQDWLNFCSTVSTTSYGGEQDFVGIGCSWQFVIPAAKLPSYESFGLNSTGLKALLGQAQAAGGLAVRFRCYEVEPGLTDSYLDYQIQQGQFPSNPAYGYLVGTIGVWNADEPQSEPAGRKLQASYRSASPQQPILDKTDPGRPAMSWATGPAGETVTTVTGCAYPWMGPPALIGNVVVNVRQDPPLVSLDLIETFPKLGFRNPNGPQMPANPATPAKVPQGFDQPKQMAFVGAVELAVIPAGKTEAEAIRIAMVDYGYDDYSKYEDWGGIIDVSYDASLYPVIAQGQLILRGNAESPSGVNAGVTLIKETIIRIVTNDRTAYLAYDNAPYPFHIKVYERGGPATRDVTLYLNEYKNVVQLKPETKDNCSPSTDNQYRTNQSVGIRTGSLDAPPEMNPPPCPPADNQEEPSRLVFPASVTIPAGTTGWTPIMISPNPESGGGAAVLAFQPDQDYIYGTIPPKASDLMYALAPAGVPMWSTATYSSVRVYEKEDFSELYAKPGGLQWMDVYDNALRYYALIFPAMSAIIPLNSSSSITSPYNASSIKQRLNTPDSPMFYSTLNMPVTRTLSPPRIKLILDFIDQSQGT